MTALATQFEFGWFPDADWTSKKKPNVNGTKFGDGYELRVNTGLNSNPVSYSLNFSRDSYHVYAIDRFLAIMEGSKSFVWKTPLMTNGSFVCREWSTNRVNPAIAKLSATFEQVFEQTSTIDIDYDYGADYERFGETARANQLKSLILQNHPLFSKSSLFSGDLIIGGEWRDGDALGVGGKSNLFIPSEYNKSKFDNNYYTDYFANNVSVEKWAMLNETEFVQGGKV